MTADPALTLDELPAAFRAAREAASNAARYSASSVPPSTCRYCGRHWKDWTSNDGHARCIVTAEFRAAVAQLWWTCPTLTREAIAEACGVSRGTIHAWTGHRQVEDLRCA